MTGTTAREGRFSRLIMPFELRSGKVFREVQARGMFLNVPFDVWYARVVVFSHFISLLDG